MRKRGVRLLRRKLERRGYMLVKTGRWAANWALKRQLHNARQGLIESEGVILSQRIEIGEVQAEITVLEAITATALRTAAKARIGLEEMRVAAQNSEDEITDETRVGGTD